MAAIICPIVLSLIRIPFYAQVSNQGEKSISRTDQTEKKQNTSPTHGDARLVPAKRTRHDADQGQQGDERTEQCSPEFRHGKEPEHLCIPFWVLASCP